MNTNNFKKLAIATGMIVSMGTLSSAHATTDLSTLANINDYKNVWAADGTATGGTGGNSFNPIQSIKQWEPWIKPIKITISEGSRIDSVKIEYGYSEADSKGALPTSNGHGYGGSGGDPESLYLQDDEFIERVDICSTDSDTSKGRVGRMTVYTTYQQQTFGSACKGQNTYIAETGWHIIGFKGRQGEEIDQLEPIYAPKLKVEVSVQVGALQDLEEPEVRDYLSIPYMNDSSTTKNISKTYSETTGYTASTSWSNTATFSLGYSISHSMQVGLAVDGLSASSSYSQTLTTEFVEQFQYGRNNSDTFSSTDTETLTLPIAPRTFEIAKIRRVEATATAPLNIYYRNIYTNTMHRSTGDIQKFTFDQISTASFEVGVFVDGLIEVHPWYMNNPVYACFDGKTADDGLVYCPVN